MRNACSGRAARGAKMWTRLWMTCAVVGCAMTGQGVAIAQPAPRRLELGGMVSTLGLADGAGTNVGVGGRVTLNLARWLGVEDEYQFVPDDTFTLRSAQGGGRVAGLRYQRRRSTALFGVKAGYRGERVGVFAKVRPGVTSLSNRGVDCLGEVCALVLLAVPEYRPEFALDLGGVVEVYPSARWLVRADVGVLRIRHRGSAPPCGSACTTSDVAASLGVAVRF